MAVQAHHQCIAHEFPGNSLAIRPQLDSAPVLLAGHLPAAAAQQAVAGNAASSDVTCYNDEDDDAGAGGCFLPRKRARAVDVAGAGFVVDRHGALLPPLPVQRSRRVLCSAAASTSGRPSGAAPASSHGLVSLLYRHSVEIDALVRTENERLRESLEAARRSHVKAVVSALDRAAARLLGGAEAELERVLVRNAELEEKLRQASAEWQAWQGVARSHEAVAAGLRATLNQLLLQSPRAGAGTRALGEGDAEDAQSCCFEQEPVADGRARACKSCGEVGACVLLVPCRHLCLCAGCEAAVDACPVCSATKNASLHVLFS